MQFSLHLRQRVHPIRPSNKSVRKSVACLWEHLDVFNVFFVCSVSFFWGCSVDSVRGSCADVSHCANISHVLMLPFVANAPCRCRTDDCSLLTRQTSAEPARWLQMDASIVLSVQRAVTAVTVGRLGSPPASLAEHPVPGTAHCSPSAPPCAVLHSYSARRPASVPHASRSCTPHTPPLSTNAPPGEG